MANYASQVIQVATGEVGYLEKKTNANLYDKTGNAGYNNYTKYAYEFDTKYPTFYNGRKNGFDWCDMFVDWCFVKAYGVEEAKKLLGQPNKSCGAGCTYSMRYYRNDGRLMQSPKAGDQIFFGYTKDESYHTGLVYAVDKTYVYTIEGNTSSASGVVANGGAVAKKKYKLSYNRIVGYGRPKYDKETASKPTTTTTTTTKPATTTSKVNPKVLEWQKSAIADGFKFPKSGADGIWGSECESVAKKAICQKRLTGYKYKNLTKIVQKAVGLTGDDVDGLFGSNTKKAVIAYQKKNGLTADGVVGINTWKKILGIK